MKKKLLSLLLVCVMMLLPACSPDSDSSSKKGSGSGDNVTVEITVPADIVEGYTQEELDEEVQEKGYKSATLNSDGSVTYVMTKGKHKEVMSEMKKSLNETFREMVESEEYSFTDIKANSNYTDFTVTTVSEELGVGESLMVMTFYLAGGMYNTFNGTPVDNVHVTFINADTGAVIQEADSKDMGE